MRAMSIKILRVAIIPAGAFVAWGFWGLEIFAIRDGWRSTAWLSGFNWSAIPICVVIASVCAFTVEPDRDRFGPLPFILCASILFLSAFLMSKTALEEFYASAMGAALGALFPYDALLKLVYGGLAVSFILPLLARWRLGPMRLRVIFALAAALLFVEPASYFIGRLALFRPHHELDDVKFGYPVLLAALFVPSVMHFASKRISSE
jgi:hypothetical protein